MFIVVERWVRAQVCYIYRKAEWQAAENAALYDVSVQCDSGESIHGLIHKHWARIFREKRSGKLKVEVRLLHET